MFCPTGNQPKNFFKIFSSTKSLSSITLFKGLIDHDFRKHAGFLRDSIEGAALPGVPMGSLPAG